MVFPWQQQTGKHGWSEDAAALQQRAEYSLVCRPQVWFHAFFKGVFSVRGFKVTEGIFLES